VIEIKLFFDTNLFLCFATDFENNHIKCQKLFFMSVDKHTGHRVNNEINKVKTRRRSLYRDLVKFLTQNLSINNYKPSIPIKRNDRIHLKYLLKHVKSMNSQTALTYTRKLGRMIDQGVKKAISLITRPFVKPSGDLACEAIMEMCIGNGNDARILVDALCWSEETSKATFCTIDYSDIISKRTKIYRRIDEIRAYDPGERPLAIKSLDELIS